MQLSELQSRCRSRFRDPSNDIVTDAEWTDYLNDAYMEVVAATPWLATREVDTTAAFTVGVNTATITGMWRVETVDDGDDYLSPVYGKRPMDSSGAPRWFRMLGNTLYVYPTPDTNTTLNVSGWAAPALLVNGTDVPGLPPEHHNLLVLGALAGAYADDGQPDQAGIFREAFVNGVQRMAVDLSVDREGPLSIPDTFFEVE